MRTLRIGRKPFGVVAVALAAVLATHSLADPPTIPLPKCDGRVVRNFKKCADPTNLAAINKQVGPQQTCAEASPCGGYQSFDYPYGDFECYVLVPGSTFAVTLCGPKIGITPSPLPVPYQQHAVCFTYRPCVLDEDGLCTVSTQWQDIYSGLFENKACQNVVIAPGGPG